MYIKTLLSQRNPIWAKAKLGQKTIGQVGCTITSLAMLEGTTPDVLAKSLKFTSDGLIIWQSCQTPLKWESREYTRNDAKIAKYLADPNKAVILQVNYGTHWVVPVSYFPDGTYICADPWSGTYENLLLKYHNITGASYFVKP